MVARGARVEGWFVHLDSTLPLVFYANPLPWFWVRSVMQSEHRGGIGIEPSEMMPRAVPQSPPRGPGGMNRTEDRWTEQAGAAGSADSCSRSADSSDTVL
jgi:hypothetical protein